MTLKFTKLVLIGILMICFTSISQAQETTKYMQVLVVFKGTKTNVFTINEQGETEKIRLKSLSSGFGISAENVAEVQVEVQSIINEMAMDGWILKTTSNMGGDGLNSVCYMLEKRRNE